MKLVLFLNIAFFSFTSVGAALENGQTPREYPRSETAAGQCGVFPCDAQVSQQLLTDTPPEQTRSRVAAILAGQADPSSGQSQKPKNQ